MVAGVLAKVRHTQGELLGQYRCEIQVWLDPGVQTTFLGCCVGVALKQTVFKRRHVWPLGISQFYPSNLTSLTGRGYNFHIHCRVPGFHVINQVESYVHPGTNHRGHLGRTLPFEKKDIVPLLKCSDLVAIIPLILREPRTPPPSEPVVG